MSRIATFARIEADRALDEARKIIAKAARRLDLLSHDQQCDDADDVALNIARDRLDRVMGAM